MSIDAMKQALEALEECRRDPRLKYEHPFYDKTITSLRTAISEADKQEPVAWEDVLGAIARGWAYPENARKPMDVQLAVAIAKEIQDMYTTPPAAQRQPLTEWQIIQMKAAIKGTLDVQFIDFVRAIEAAHGIAKQISEE